MVFCKTKNSSVTPVSRFSRVESAGSVRPVTPASAARRREHRQVARQPGQAERATVGNCRPEPGNQVDDHMRDTITSPGPAAAARSLLISMIGPCGSDGSHSPMWTPARTPIRDR